MAKVEVGDVVHSERTSGQARILERHCPSCCRYLSKDATDCSHCGITFERLTFGYLQVTSVAR